jgi:iron-sulfur cluster repair protein YtfE (RIC family)
MSSQAQLDPTLTVNEIIQRVPGAVTTLSAHGIDTCCRGHEPLEQAAAEAGIDPAVLLAKIARAPRGLPVSNQCSCDCENCSEKDD